MLAGWILEYKNGWLRLAKGFLGAAEGFLGAAEGLLRKNSLLFTI